MSALTWEEWAAGAFLVVTVPGLWIMLPKYWCGGFSDALELGYKVLPFSPATRQGLRRAVLPLTILWTCIAIAVIDHPLTTKIQAREWTTWERWISAVLLVVALVFAFACLTVILYNWPKFLVPPVSRGENGARQMRREARARRRAGV